MIRPLGIPTISRGKKTYRESVPDIASYSRYPSQDIVGHRDNNALVLYEHVPLIRDGRSVRAGGEVSAASLESVGRRPRARQHIDRMVSRVRSRAVLNKPYRCDVIIGRSVLLFPAEAPQLCVRQGHPIRVVPPDTTKAGNRRRGQASSGIPRFALPEYIVKMRRSPLSRVTGLVLATLVGISAPGLALAHGYAHHEASEHAEHEHEHGHEHHHAAPAADEGVSSADQTASIESASSSGDHDHPQLSLGLLARAEIPLFVVPPSVTLPDYVLVDSRASLLLTAAPPRAGPPDTAPRQPRAPPFA